MPDGDRTAGPGVPVQGSRSAAAGPGMSVTRLEAFSDGVLAIVITLLILEIRVPDPKENPGQLGHELAKQWPHYAAFLLSFLVVGIIWLNHHATFNLLQRTDHGVRVLNLLLLLPVTVLPWPTDLLATFATEGTPRDQRVAVPRSRPPRTAPAHPLHGPLRSL